MKKHRKVLIGVLLVLVVAIVGIAVYAYRMMHKTNYVRDEEVELFTEILETETEPPVTAETLYHLDEVKPATSEELSGTWTLLVIGEGEKNTEWRDQVWQETTAEVTAQTADESAAAENTLIEDGALENGGEEGDADNSTFENEGVENTVSGNGPAESGTSVNDVSGEGASEKIDPESETEEQNQGYGDAKGIILMTINHNMGRVYLYSMNTSLYVEVPEYGGYRLGDIYTAGGGVFLSDVIEQNYGVSIDYYATIQMEDVARVLEMDEFADIDISAHGIDVIENLVYSMKDISPAKLGGYVANLLPYVSHNLSDMEMMKMILQIPNVVMYDSVKGSLPYEGYYQEVGELLVPDIGLTSQFLKGSIYAKPEKQETESIQAASE